MGKKIGQEEQYLCTLNALENYLFIVREVPKTKDSISSISAILKQIYLTVRIAQTKLE
jgi:hypothetical protein